MKKNFSVSKFNEIAVTNCDQDIQYDVGSHLCVMRRRFRPLLNTKSTCHVGDVVGELTNDTVTQKLRICEYLFMDVRGYSLENNISTNPLITNSNE